MIGHIVFARMAHGFIDSMSRSLSWREGVGYSGIGVMYYGVRFVGVRFAVSHSWSRNITNA